MLNANETLGQRIRKARKAMRWTAQELAAELGVSRISVWTWEKDRACPRRATLDQLATALGVSVHQLLNGWEQLEPNADAAEILSYCQRRLGAVIGIPPDHIEITVRVAPARMVA